MCLLCLQVFHVKSKPLFFSDGQVTVSRMHGAHAWYHAICNGLRWPVAPDVSISGIGLWTSSMLEPTVVFSPWKGSDVIFRGDNPVLTCQSGVYLEYLSHCTGWN